MTVTETERARETVERLRRTFPGMTTALAHKSAFELLVATILSAQTTDEQVNKVTPGLFAAFPTPAKLARARAASVASKVRSVNFFRTKAKNLVAMARALVRDHGGKVPADLEALVALPGVARKTANVVLGTWFNVASGIVVDTHVFRLAARLGFASERTPEKTEARLTAIVPKEDWIDFGHGLIWHGRKVCSARAPRCAECALWDLCRWPDKGPKET